MVVRRATHAGSWYTNKGPVLSEQLDGWLADVPSSIMPVGTKSAQEGNVTVPTSDARAIIGP
jgi:predicted class III extradiol MEMO1 family dioxygenase